MCFIHIYIGTSCAEKSLIDGSVKGQYTTIALTNSMEQAYASSIFSIFPLSMESNASDKFKKISIASKFFFRTPSIIRRIIRSCVVLEIFLRKPFL